MNATKNFLIPACLVLIVWTASKAAADFIFGEPLNLGPVVNSSFGEMPQCFSHDGLEMYICSGRPGQYGNWDLWVARRATIDGDWGIPENLGPVVNSAHQESLPCISTDDLTLYFGSDRPGGQGDFDIWVTVRATKDDVWGPPVNLGPPINSARTDGEPWFAADDLELYFESYRSGGYGRADIYVAQRATVSAPWGEPVNLGPMVNTSMSEQYLSLSPDGLLLLFSEWIQGPFRPDGFGAGDIYMVRRASVLDSWQAPVNLGPQVNGSYHETSARISPDGRTLYFASDRPGGLGGSYGDIWQAPILPIVDFNADASLDLADLVLLIENWGTSDTLYDIGPYAWGDGVVDVEDLKVFIAEWEKANPADSQDNQ